MKYGDKYVKKSGAFWICVRYVYIFISFVYVHCLRRNKMKCKKYKISICAIFKNEGLFLKEWLEYHLLIGIKHFYLYNNFSDDNYLNVLQPYIENGVVTLVQWPIRYGQKKAYDHCYVNFKDDTNWIAYVDIDEFICPKFISDISLWINKFDKYPSVVLNWKSFGVSGVLENTPTSLVIESSTQSVPYLSVIGKSIINTSYQFERISDNTDVHLYYPAIRIAGYPLKILPVNEFKKFFYHWKQRYPFFAKSKIQLNHYHFRSYNDYLYKCFRRGDAESERNEKLSKSVRFESFDSKYIEKDFVIHRFLTCLKIRMSNL